MAYRYFTLTATTGNDTKSIYEPDSTNQWVYTWDGLGGTDSLSFDRLSKSEFDIYKDASGIHVDSVSSASHMIFVTLNNVETLKFSGSTINLSTLFDTTAPTVSTFSPADGTSSVAVASNIVLTFNESVAKGTGSIQVRAGSATGTVFETFDAATSSRLTFSGSTLTIDPTNSLAGGTNYYVTLASGSVKDTTGNSYTGTSTYDFTTISTDTTAPTVSTFSPADGASSVAVASNIVLTFNESIAKGTGSIQVRAGSATGTVFETFDAATSSRLTFSGSTLTIDPTNSLAGGTNYYVTLASGSVKDTTGNSYTGTSTYDFTTISTDTTAPTVSTFSPADGASSVAVASNIVLTFNESIAKGTGSIQVRAGSATGTVFETFDAATSSRLTFSGSTLTIDPTNSLAGGTNYYVTLASGSVKDTTGNSYTGTSTYDFTTISTDTTAPTVSTFSPADGASSVAVASNIVLTFNESIAKGTGSIQVRAGSATGTVFETFDAATSSRLTFSGSTLTIDPTNSLAGGTNYYVTLASGSVKDTTGNSYTGTSTYDFTTISTDTTAPTVSTFSPADGASSVAVASNIVLTFNESIAKGTGSIQVRAGSATGTVFETFDAATSSRLTFSGSTLTIDPTNSLAGGTNYYVTLASGSVKDTTGNSYTGTSTYDFTTATTTTSTLTGTTGIDTLKGTAAADKIYGLAGNDVLAGLGGVDSMDGGEGSDIYVVALVAEHAASEIIDTGLTGTDELRFSATSGTLMLYAGDTGLESIVIGTGTSTSAITSGTSSVSANAAALINAVSITGNNGINTLTGTNYSDTLIGNAGKDILVGGIGNDVLRGGLGNDNLTGGVGVDYFRFDTTPNATSNLDTLTDFSITDDTIELENAIFIKLVTTGTLTTGFLSKTGVAVDANDYIIYNSTTGALSYDADGSGAASKAIVFASITTGLTTLSEADFIVI